MQALVLHPARPGGRDRDAGDALTEAVSLASALDLDVVGAEIVPLARARAGTLFGSGKVEEITAKVTELEAGLVIVDGTLSPVPRSVTSRSGASSVSAITVPGTNPRRVPGLPMSTGSPPVESASHEKPSWSCTTSEVVPGTQAQSTAKSGSPPGR